jgi:hypothetical protein
MGDLANSFYTMIQLYVLRNVVEAAGNLTGIGLNILNGVVPLSIGMLLW